MNSVTDSLWADILAYLRIHNPDLVRGWFSQLVPVKLEQGILEVGATNDSQQQYLGDHCHRPFAQAAQAATGRLVTIRFIIREHEDQPQPEAQVPLPFEADVDQITLNGLYTFEQFVTGPCNRLAHAACVAVGESPGKAYNPLFIHGSVGLGKTHLLQAACHRVIGVNPSAKVLFLSCETFTNHFIEAVERGAMNTFRYRYRHVDVLVIDDIQFLGARERSQEEFFHTFNTLYQLQKQIILSADSPPAEIPSLEDRLVSRFNWGLVARIDPPCFDTRLAIVRKKAKTMNMPMSDEVMHLVVNQVTTNARELEGALLRLHALSAHDGIEITRELALRSLGNQTVSPPIPVTIPAILELVTEHYGVRLADLQSKKRSKSIAFPRQICMYLARTLTNHSLEEIGGYFGGRDHSTVLHATRTITQQRDNDPEFRSTLESISNMLRS